MQHWAAAFRAYRAVTAPKPKRALVAATAATPSTKFALRLQELEMCQCFKMAAPTMLKHEKNLRPKVGVGVVITSPLHPKCVLIGKRKNVHGDGYYALPGGHLEYTETWEECAVRETLEETGLTITGVIFDKVINAVMEEDKYHYVVMFMKGQIDLTQHKEPRNMEPNKCEGWEWWDWDKFPKPDELFCPLRIAREKGYNPFTDN